jgi:hypothetical protein
MTCVTNDNEEKKAKPYTRSMLAYATYQEYHVHRQTIIDFSE